MLVIGSTALRLIGFYTEKPKDIDLVGTYEQAVEFARVVGAKTFYPINSGQSFFLRLQDDTICEIEIAWPDSRAERLLKFIGEDRNRVWSIESVQGVFCAVPSPNVLYMLKMSHRFLKDSPHFLKTMKDIHYLRDMGCTIPYTWQEFYKQREKDTYVYSHPKLNVSKEGFFDSKETGVPQVYDHDSIHEAVAIYDRPAYTYYSIDGAEVACSREKFEACEYDIRLAGVVEEAMVLALERSLVPFPGKKTPEEAFLFALQKVCTSITSGWFREFSWESYDDAVGLFNYTTKNLCYTKTFNDAVAVGLVKLKDASSTY